MTAQKRSKLPAIVMMVLSLVTGALAGGSLLGGSLLLGAGAASASTVDVTPGVSPPGANDWACKPGKEHPYPVVLVPGTFESMVKNWSTLSPVLKSQGYCVFALDYGQANGIDASGPVADSARELAPFIDAVLAATGARQVDIVGHSQGGMMPRYYMGFLGGAKKVHHLVGISPSNHGTEGLILPPPEYAPSQMQLFGPFCQACLDQEAGSAFLTELNSIGDTVRGPSYTVISTRLDEVVTPYQSQFLAGGAQQVTNITLQDACPLDVFEHDQTPNDPVVHQWVSNALSQADGPADPGFRPRCP